MEDSLYYKIDRRFNLYYQIFSEFEANTYVHNPDRFSELTEIYACLEFDSFVKEYPNTYKEYIVDFLGYYEIMLNDINEVYPPENENDAMEYRFPWGDLGCGVENIIEHLKEILNKSENIGSQTEIQPKEEPQTPIPPKKQTRMIREQTFEGLFRDKEKAQKVREILESREYITKGGIWQGLTNDRTELLCAYYALKPILKPHHKTPTIKIFYREFGLPDDHISDRMKTEEQFNANRDEFDRIFSHLIP